MCAMLISLAKGWNKCVIKIQGMSNILVGLRASAFSSPTSLSLYHELPCKLLPPSPDPPGCPMRHQPKIWSITPSGLTLKITLWLSPVGSQCHTNCKKQEALNFRQSFYLSRYFFPTLPSCSSRQCLWTDLHLFLQQSLKVERARNSEETKPSSKQHSWPGSELACRPCGITCPSLPEPLYRARPTPRPWCARTGPPKS